MLFGDGFVNIVIDETLLLFCVRGEPNVVIGIGGMQSFGERRRAWGEKILGGGDTCLGGIVGSVGSNEGADGGVGWEKDDVSQEGGPVLFEVGKRD